MEYCYAKRVWRRGMSSWEDRMRIFLEEKDEEIRNAKWVYGVHYLLDSWEETKNRWRHRWNLFQNQTNPDRVTITITIIRLDCQLFRHNHELSLELILHMSSNNSYIVSSHS